MLEDTCFLKNSIKRLISKQRFSHLTIVESNKLNSTKKLVIQP